MWTKVVGKTCCNDMAERRKCGRHQAPSARLYWIREFNKWHEDFEEFLMHKRSTGNPDTSETIFKYTGACPAVFVNNLEKNYL